MMRSSLPLPHQRWAHVPVGHTQMAPPLVPSPIPRPARPHRGLAASRRRRRGAAPGVAPAPVTLTVLDQATRMGWAVAAPEAALALARETQLVLAPEVAGAAAPVEGTNPAQVLARETQLVLAPEVAGAAAPVEGTNPAQVLVTLTALAPAINPEEAVGTKSRFGGE